MSSATSGDLHRARPRWLRGCVALAAGLLALMIAACSLSGLGIRNGVISPPHIESRLGPLQLIALSTLTPDCALAFPCGQPLLLRSPTIQRFYVVWVVVAWSDASGNHINSYRLVQIQLKR
jgi:hypothetical protein